MQPSVIDIIKSQRATVPPVLTADLSGKTVIVTGGNGGIGYETVKHFAKMNAGNIVIACRSREKGEAAVAKLKEETGYSNAQVRLLDLAKFTNASIATFDYRTTQDGWEETLQVNNLSTLLCCILLVPILLRTGEQFKSQPRIVIVGSGVHYYQSGLDENVIHAADPLKMFSSAEYCKKSVMATRYYDSKLLSLFITRSLAEVLKNTPIIANVVDPGFCYSDLRREASRIQQFAFKMLEKFMARTTEEGSRQLVWAALAQEEGGLKLRGAYVDSMAVVEPSDYSISHKGLRAQEVLWAAMVKELGKVDSRMTHILNSLST
ncbi:hypothetical protein CC2G_008058 [Coprinopsis cinerea AmutBmut pab1-1]|nr:hypothetical protein CC2G_008058 [Coprinopsis cinerea AmutBmut pab1-1]